MPVLCVPCSASQLSNASASVNAMTFHPVDLVHAAQIIGRRTVPFAVGTLSVFLDAACQASLVRLVGRDQPAGGNSALEGSRSAARTGGPALGGMLVTSWPDGPVPARPAWAGPFRPRARTVADHVAAPRNGGVPGALLHVVRRLVCS